MTQSLFKGVQALEFWLRAFYILNHIWQGELGIAQIFLFLNFEADIRHSVL
jgi:hypothetical protein